MCLDKDESGNNALGCQKKIEVEKENFQSNEKIKNKNNAARNNKKNNS